jgi:16S rRNA pseudouridine516 synthase
MSDLIRLDKFLSNQGIGSRSEVKKYIKNGKVTHHQLVINDPKYKVLTSDTEVSYNSRPALFDEFVYIMLNKPKNVISATEDNYSKTVLDIIEHPLKKKMFPVGRLDKDTTGLLLITNDGNLAHNLLSPKKHVDKSYEVLVFGNVTEDTIHLFLKGVVLEDGYKTMPSELKVIKSDDETTLVEITIKEGKFHQIKRMFSSVSMEVVELKRLSMGSVVLDENLKEGDYRVLTDSELKSLVNR